MARAKALVPRTVDLEALLLRDYQLNGRRSGRRASAAFRNVQRHLEEIEPSRAYLVTMEYAAARAAEGAKPATVRYEIAMVGRALSIAHRVGMIREKATVARPRVVNARTGFITRGELRLLRRRLGEPLSDAALFAFVTGWRRSEVFGLTWASVDWAGGVVRLEPGTTKSGQGRTYPFGAHREVRRMIEGRFLERRGPYVFGRPHGGRVVDFRRTWKNACRAAGLGSILFHDLRRSAVRNMERAGVPRSVAMALIGHKTESIYRRYAITNEEDLARGVRLVSRLGAQKGSGGGGAREAKGADGRLLGDGEEGDGLPVGQADEEESGR